ncbi:DUF819 domain-containing protein [Aquipluma nitroreducens]|uniref:DUF819 domain-containing protein n=1 Tax=Aquipluma nitroreducens TaxID=2010828 RepID=A0A5K7S4T6_9BACT|nr:DUF819 family protein [Aquipluma nitroreducens]BBE16364.1 DUF819 domain-containing protein [Aquipluma nitroreducens]
MSLISPENNLVLFAVIVGAAALGIWSEHKKWLGQVSGILVTMILMSVLSMSGVIPVASNPKIKVEVYDLIFSYFIPMSIPMMLMGSNITRIIREGGKLLVAFLIGALGVILGSFLAFYIINLGDDSGNTAGVIAATLIGGSMNFIATGEILNFSTHPLFSATIAVDNFAANAYILLMFAVPSMTFLARFFVKPKVENTQAIEKNLHDETYPITMERIAISVLIAAVIASVGGLISDIIQKVYSTRMSTSILIITVLAVLVANLFPKKLKKLEDTAFSIGLWMMYVFLAVIGASTNLSDMLHVGPAVLAFYLIIMFFHFIFLVSLSKLFKLDVYEVIISSAANIMGPSVAAPMAASLGQKKLITPAILVGILGYVIGTFIGVSIAMALN